MPAALLAPIGMIGGWTVAAAVQGEGFDPVRDTISALATQAAVAPAIMTAGLALTAVGHVASAVALRPAARPGRLLLAVGGVATALVAALPVDAHPRAHGISAAVAFGALSVWPAAAGRRGANGPLSPVAGAVVTGGLLVLLGWFVVELQSVGSAGAATGLAERAVAGAQSLVPLALVVALRLRSGRS
ncbi:DUF998 domain-containing protein [Pengzhenrongella frigida]|uniref:DUF998 domain-containing protein n=1 Tax=Pengzhenrongella frigida TaxID=1259133 RepID=UPI0013EE0FF4|nr:DUF998 domain-containing protein [Cellulomonas sp. HLT2-17]